MVIRSTALQSALTGITAAHNQVAATAVKLANPSFASRASLAERNSSKVSSDGDTESVSDELGGGLLALNESLTQVHANSATASAARDMFDELLQIGRK